MCSTMAQAYWSLVTSARASSFIFFTDIIGAFDAIIRRFLSDTRDHDEKIVHTLCDLGLPPAVLHEFAQRLSDGSINVLPDLGVSEHMRLIIADSLANTWHTIQGCSELSLALLGTKPGDPLGSLFFNFVMLKVLRRCEDTL